MEVSHFELLFKFQAPADAAGTPVDKVIQGYFLEITNLENVALRFQLEFVALPPAAGQVDRSLAGNTTVLVDTPGLDNQAGVLSGTFTSSVFRPSTGNIQIAPLATALVAVLPSVFVFPGAPDTSPLTMADFEVRGFVRIKLPALFPRPPQLPFFTIPQSNAPVRVLLTPQNRASFISGTTSAIVGQTQASLPTASGAALNLVPPEPGGPIILGPLAKAGATPKLLALLEENPELASADMLAALLAQIDPAKGQLEAFNKALIEAGSKVTIAGGAEGRRQPGR